MKRAVLKALDRIGLHIGPSEARRVVRLLKSTGVDVVFDIGAANGRYGVGLRSAGYEGSIVSCEPLAGALHALNAAANNDSRWFVEPVALGSEVGEATINVAANSDSSSLLPMLDDHTRAAPHAGYVSEETVRVDTLDRVFDRHQGLGRSPMLKLDTQGFEREVLAGGQRSLEAAVAVHVEVSFVPLYEGGPSWDEMLLMLRDAGFTPALMAGAFMDPSDGRWLQADVLMVRR